MIQLLKQAFYQIGLHPLRSFLTVLGIVNGIMALVVIVAISHSTNKVIESQLEELGTNLLVIRPYFAYGESALVPTRIQYSLEDMAQIKNTALSVEEVAPSYQNSLHFQYGHRSLSINIVGTNDKYATVKNLTMRQGRFLSSMDITSDRFVVVLNETAAQRLGAMTDLSSDVRVRIAGIMAKIVGIVQDKTTEGGGVPMAYLPLPLYDRLVAQGANNPLEIYIRVKKEFSVNDGIREIKSFLKATHGPLAEESLRSMTDFLEVSREIQTRAMWVFFAMAGIALLLGGVGLTNLLMISVRERTREIGIRKAVGAKDRAILFQFVAEGIILSLGGGLVGVLLRIWAITMVLPVLNLPVHIPLSAIWTGVFFSAGLGVLGSFYPAWVAA